MVAGIVPARRASDHRMFLLAALAVAALVLLGFGKSYFFRLIFTQTTSLTALVHLHGALMTAWIALFIAQVALVSSGRIDLHRRLGRLGVVLLVLIVIVVIPMTLIAAKLGGDHMPGPPLPGLALVIGLLVEFVTLAGVGILYRRHGDIHKRLMLLSSIAAMEAGVSRLPVAFLDSVLKIHLANDAILLLVVVCDSVNHRRLHPAFWWGSLFLISIQTLAALISHTEVWLQTAHHIMRVVG